MRAILSSLCAAGAVAQYALDSTWNVEKDVPKAAAIGVSGDEVFVATEGGTPVHVFDKQSGTPKRTFGKGDVQKAHGIRIQRSSTANEADTVWVTDMKAGKMVQFSLDGKKIGSFGTHGNGKGQFLAPADIAFHGDVAYVSDGDTGNDNRVTAWKLSGGGMQWQTKSAFNSPHSIEYHEQMNKLVVANRFAKNIHVLDPTNGNDEGTLKCDALGLGESKPYGVRVIGSTLLVVSNDGKKGHQFLHMVELSSGMECGKMLQTIPIDAKTCATPHLLGIDRDREDVYVACLAGGGVKRFTKQSLHIVV